MLNCDLNNSNDNHNWLSVMSFYVSIEGIVIFLSHHNLIQGDPVIRRGRRGPKQLLVKHQLTIFMHLVGREGETNLKQRSVFHVSEGHCKKAHDHVVQALTNLRDGDICWPDVDERKQISHRIEEKYHLLNCVGMMDRTLLELGITS